MTTFSIAKGGETSGWAPARRDNLDNCNPEQQTLVDWSRALSAMHLCARMWRLRSGARANTSTNTSATRVAATARPLSTQSKTRPSTADAGAACNAISPTGTQTSNYEGRGGGRPFCRFMDGTGVVMWPNGSVAMATSVTASGKYSWVFGDIPDAPLLFFASPHGHGAAFSSSGQPRLVFNARGGAEMKGGGRVDSEWTGDEDTTASVGLPR